MSKALKIIILFIQFVHINCNYFSVIGSAILRIDEPYKVAVTSHSDGEIIDFQIGIIGTTFQGDLIEKFENLQVNPLTTKVIKLAPQNLTLGSYKLKVESLNFTNSVELYLNPHRVSLLVQLNKPLYRTSDCVNFRVFAINSRTKPYRVEKYSKITILDEKNNELRRWENFDFKNGLFEGNFEYFGLEASDYEILVDVDGSIASKTFKIINHKRKLYEVLLNNRKTVSFRDGSINLKVSIKRNFKSPSNDSSIIGKLIIICDEMKILKYQEIFHVKTFEVAKAIDFKADLNLLQLNRTRKFNLEAIFVDDVSGRNFTAKSDFTIELSDFKVDVVNSHKYFKTEIPYGFAILVADFDGNLVKNESIFVSVENNFGEQLIRENFTLNSGYVEVKTPAINSNTKQLKITAKFDQIQYTKIVNKMPSQKSESISINLLTAIPRMYEKIEFDIIASNEATQFVVFQLFSKGLLRMSKMIKLSNGYAKFNLMPKFSHTPKSHVIVFYIDEYGDIFSGELSVSYYQTYSNYLTITSNSSKLSASSTSNSSLSIFAIENSQYSHHDNLKATIFDHELMKYDRASIEDFYDSKIPFWFYPMSYQRRFFEVGAVILTNAVQKIPCRKSIENEAILNDEIEIDINENEEVDYVEGFFIKSIVLNSSNEGEIEILNENFRDLSTEWRINGVSLSDKYGIAMANEDFVIDRRKKFYIKIDMPEIAKVDEIITVVIEVFNKYEKNLTTNVEFFSNELNLTADNWSSIDGGLSQSVEIKINSSTKLNIDISSSNFGDYEIEVKAKHSQIIESKKIQLKILPNGIKSESTDVHLITTEECYGNTSKILKCNLPTENIIKNSLNIEASIVGDIIGLTLSTLDEFSKETSGSAEEVLHNFALNVLTIDYLVMTDQLTSVLKLKLVDSLTQLYQKLIKHRNIDGSFSSFNNKFNTNSIHLTANALRYLRKAQRYLPVNEEIFIEGLALIASKQKSNGQFITEGEDDIVLTSFIGILFDEFSTSFPQYISTIYKARQFIESNYTQNDIYTLAISTYFAFQVDSKIKFNLYQKLSNNMKNVNLVDIETSAYSLLTLDHIPERYDDAFNALKWLLSQRYYDNVVAFEAVSKFAVRLIDNNKQLSVELRSEIDDVSEYAVVNGDNKLVSQSFEFPSTSSQLHVSASGNGFAIVKLTCTYYSDATYDNSAIKITTNFVNSSCIDYITIKIKLTLLKDELSGILTAKIEVPTGYAFDNDDAELFDYALNIEERHKGSILYVYLTNLSDSVEFEISFVRVFAVTQRGFSSIEVIDFKHEDIKSSTFYKLIENLPLCDEKSTKMTARESIDICHKCFN